MNNLLLGFYVDRYYTMEMPVSKYDVAKCFLVCSYESQSRTPTGHPFADGVLVAQVYHASHRTIRPGLHSPTRCRVVPARLDEADLLFFAHTDAQTQLFHFAQTCRNLCVAEGSTNLCVQFMRAGALLFAYRAVDETSWQVLWRLLPRLRLRMRP